LISTTNLQYLFIFLKNKTVVSWPTYADCIHSESEDELLSEDRIFKSMLGTSKPGRLEKACLYPIISILDDVSTNL